MLLLLYEEEAVLRQTSDDVHIDGKEYISVTDTASYVGTRKPLSKRI